MRILLDTDAYSAFKRGHEDVQRLIRNSREIVFSVVVLGELLFGFRLGTREDRNRAELQTFLDSPYVRMVPVSPVTADQFARVAGSLRKLGTPIPTNDMWIAAHALETGAELVSFDAHFDVVAGLATRRPLSASPP